MHNAPSVSYPVGRSLVAGVLATLAWLLGALAIGWWTVQSQVEGWRLVTACGVLAAAAVIAAWQWWVTPSGILGWDGQSWTWTIARRADAGAAEVCLDLQQWLLVHWRGEAGSNWLWLERARSVERWDDLRRAVYSRAKPETLPEAKGGAAEP